MKHIFTFKTKNSNYYLYNSETKYFYTIDECSYNLIKQNGNANLLATNTNEGVESGNMSLNKEKNQKITANQNAANKTNIIKKFSPAIIEKHLSNFPHLVFEVTEQCNLNCTYCTYGDFYNGHDPRQNQSLSVKAAKKLIDKIYAYCNSRTNFSFENVFQISFYGGEPLLKIEFIKEIVEYTKQRENNKVRFIYSMTTNALLLHKHMDFIVNNEFELLLSIDGNEFHNSYRVLHNGNNSFDIIYKNIHNLKNSYQEYFDKFVNINSVLHNRNSSIEIFEFIKKEFNKEPIISEVSSDGLIENKKEEFSKLFKNMHEDLKQSEDYFHINNINRIENDPDFKEAVYFIFNLTNLVYPSRKALQKAHTINLKPTGTCLPFAKKIFVTANGKILLCENVPHKYDFGSISDDHIDFDTEKIASIYNQQLEKMYELCNSCYRKFNCGQCMYFLELSSDKVKCHGYMNSKAFEKELSYMMSYFEDNPKLFKKIIHEASLT